MADHPVEKQLEELIEGSLPSEKVADLQQHLAQCPACRETMGLRKGSPFGSLQCLPRDGRPVVCWPIPDEAWLNVTEGIYQSIMELKHTV